MQQEFTETSEQRLQSNSVTTTPPQSQHGNPEQEPLDLGLHRVPSGGSSSASIASANRDERDSLQGVDANSLDEKLRGLSHRRRTSGRWPTVAGQRIADYENALTPPTPRQALGFKVVKRNEPGSDGPQLEDFPNGMKCSPGLL